MIYYIILISIIILLIFFLCKKHYTDLSKEEEEKYKLEKEISNLQLKKEHLEDILDQRDEAIQKADKDYRDTVEQYTKDSVDQRRQDVDALAGVFFLNQLLDLLIGIAHHLFAGDIRVGFGRARIEQAQEVVDFGDCADGRARVLVRRLLLDGDDRREARNLVDVRAFGAAEKLPCVGRKGLDVAALAFGIDGVESQRRLAAAAHAGDDHQPVARNGDVDVFQIVLAGAIDADVFFLGINGFGRIVGCLSHCGCRLLFVGCKDSAKRAQNGQNLF